MISKQQLHSYTNLLGYSLGQVEKDYLQHLFLFYLYNEVSTEFVFKGGTALQKCFGLDRFSEDLDFTYQGEQNKVEFIINKAINNFSQIFETTPTTLSEKHQSNSIMYYFKIKGPLYSGKPLSFCHVQVDISFREKVILEPMVQQIIPLYQSLRPYTVTMLSYEEIFAEKIRALCTRSKARDIYDVWYLLNKNIRFNPELTQKKLDYYKLELSNDFITEKLMEKEKLYTKELKPLVKNIPDFNYIVKEILHKIPV